MVLLHNVSHHPIGELLVTDRFDGKVLDEGYLRQCVHCQYTWTHRPGSGILRGFCMNCMGHTCGRKACDTCYPKEQRIEDMEAVYLRNKHAVEAAVRIQALRERLFG